MLIFTLASSFTIAIANEPSLKDITLKDLKRWDSNASCTGENLAFKCNAKPIKPAESPLESPFDFLGLQDYHLDVKASQNSIETNAKVFIVCNDTSFCDAKAERVLPKVAIINEKMYKNGAIIRIQDEITIKTNDGSTLFIEADYSVKFNNKFKQASLVDFLVQKGSAKGSLDLIKGMRNTPQAKNTAINVKKIKIIIDSPTFHKVAYEIQASKSQDGSYNPKKYESDIQFGIGLVQFLIYSNDGFRTLSKQTIETIDKILENAKLFLLGKKHKIGVELRFKNKSYVNLDQIDEDILKLLNLLEIKAI